MGIKINKQSLKHMSLRSLAAIISTALCAVLAIVVVPKPAEAAALGPCFVSVYTSQDYSEKMFTDMSWNSISGLPPHCKEIRLMKIFGISTGFSDGSYRPTNTVLRQDMAAFLRRTRNYAVDTSRYTRTTTFKDVPVSQIKSNVNHADDVYWLAANGITTGFSDGTFRGTQSVIRQDMAAFLYRAAGSPDYTPSAADKSRFKDVSEHTPHAKEIWWCASNGISTGWDDGTFRPTNTVLRQDMAAFLIRLLELTHSHMRAAADSEDGGGKVCRICGYKW